MSKRGDVFHKTNGHCAYCGKQLAPFGKWHIDHATPKNRGGNNHLDNLTPSCPACNHRKKTQTVAEFRDWITSRVTTTILETLIPHLHWATPMLDTDTVTKACSLLDQVITVIQNSQTTLYFERQD